MRVALFIDGNNYYLALRDFDASLELDMERLTTWLTRAAAGRLKRFVGAYYYTGVVEGDSPLGEFLASLETRTGYFVRREPRVRRTSTCRSCGVASEYFTEKRVDTRLVAEMLQLAAVGAYDVACLLSGDDDFVPALQAVGALGKQVYLATWPGQGVSRDLRAASFGVIDLAEGVGEFSTGRKRPGYAAPVVDVGAGRTAAPDPVRAVDPSGQPTPAGQAVLAEIRDAQAQLSYVSRWYFTNKWRGSGLPPEPGVRERMIDELVAGGWLEGYTATDDKGRPVMAARMAELGGASGEGLPLSRPSQIWNMAGGAGTCVPARAGRKFRDRPPFHPPSRHPPDVDLSQSQAEPDGPVAVVPQHNCWDEVLADLDRTTSSIRRDARRMNLPASDIDDVVGEVLCQAWAKRDQFDPSRPIVPWLRGVGRKAIVERLLGRSFENDRGVDALDPEAVQDWAEPRPEEQLAAKEARARLRALLRTAPARYREVLVARYWEGMRISEVAAWLGQPPKAVRRRLERALAWLEKGWSSKRLRPEARGPRKKAPESEGQNTPPCG
jgi:RNA polymerase sigma-70 factor (ECF subfamily)